MQAVLQGRVSTTDHCGGSGRVVGMPNLKTGEVFRINVYDETTTVSTNDPAVAVQLADLWRRTARKRYPGRPAKMHYRWSRRDTPWGALAKMQQVRGEVLEGRRSRTSQARAVRNFTPADVESAMEELL